MPKVEVKTHPELMIEGLKYHGKNQAGEIPQLWEQLWGRQGDIENMDHSIIAGYGISIMGPDFNETMIFDYIAGYPVTEESSELPDDMRRFIIPEGQYAVITVPNLASISNAYDAVYRWIGASAAYDLDLSSGNFNFERYGEEFNPQAGSEKFFIYAPIKER
mgnify:CR=1 FL=1